MAIKHSVIKKSGERGYASEWNADHIIENQTIENNHIKDGAITTNKIADQAVSNDKILDNTITANKIAFQLPSNYIKKFYDYVVPSDTTNITISNLNLDNDLYYYIIFFHKNPRTNAEVYIKLQFNDYTTNYVGQKLLAEHTSITGSMLYDNVIHCTTRNSRGLYFISVFKQSNFEPVAYCVAPLGYLYIRLIKHNYTYNVTSISLKTDTTDGIGAGSRVIAFKLVSS